MSAKEKFKLSPLVNEFVPRCYKQSAVENAFIGDRNSSTPSTATKDKINKQTFSRSGATGQKFNNLAGKDTGRNNDYKTTKFVQTSLTRPDTQRCNKELSSSNYERCTWSDLKEKPQRTFNNRRSFEKNDGQASGSSARSGIDSSQFRKSRAIPNEDKNVSEIFPKSQAFLTESFPSSNVGDGDGSNSNWIEVKSKSTKDKRPRSQNFEFSDYANSRTENSYRNEIFSVSKPTTNSSRKNKDDGASKKPPTLPSADKDKINSNKDVAINSADFGNKLEGAKKKKKTSAQRREEYQKKLQCLPSTQGKVVTVTSDVFHFINSGERVSLKSREKGEEYVELGQENFPVLGAHSSITKSVGNEDDSCWSDIETIEKTQKSKNTVHSLNKHQKMEDYPELNASNTKKTFNVSKKPNYSELFKKVALNQSSCDSETIDDSVGRQDNSSSKIRKDVKSVPQVQNNVTSKPKSNSLIKLDIVNMIHVKKENHKSKHSANIKEKKMVKIKPVVANILDSSAPARRRGKEREIPRKKKHTTLKKIILKERQDRKLARETIVTPEVVAPEETGEELKTETPKEIICTESSILNIENQDAVSIKHSRKFREYCSQKLSPEIDEVATKLIQDLIRFHDRVYQKDPVKAKMRRRMVVGLKEITKHMKLKRIKCLILAPNLERISNQGGLDDVMGSILSLAEENNVPVVFALGRRKLGRVCLKKVPVSGVGIFNYDGSEVNFKKLMELVMEEKQSYSNEFGKKYEQLNDPVN